MKCSFYVTENFSRYSPTEPKRGLAGSVCAPSLWKEDGGLLGAMLRWQGLQGNRVRQKFMTILA